MADFILSLLFNELQSVPNLYCCKNQTFSSFVVKCGLCSSATNPPWKTSLPIKQISSRVCQLIRGSKKSFCRAYVSSLSHHSFSMVVWHKIRKIKGTLSLCTITGLAINGSIETAPDAVVNKLATYYESVSSCKQYRSIFQSIKNTERKQDSWFLYIVHREYNLCFSLVELKSSSVTKNIAPSPGNIHNSTLQNLLDTALQILLSLFNHVWMENTISGMLKTASSSQYLKQGRMVLWYRVTVPSFSQRLGTSIGITFYEWFCNLLIFFQHPDDWKAITAGLKWVVSMDYWAWIYVLIHKYKMYALLQEIYTPWRPHTPNWGWHVALCDSRRIPGFHLWQVPFLERQYSFSTN